MSSLAESTQPAGSARAAHVTGDLPPRFTMAFQPIVDLERCEVLAFEALARGPRGEPAAGVFAHVNPADPYAFDQACRAKAIDLAARLGMTACLSLNFLPNAVYYPRACIRATLEAARRGRFPVEKIIFEVTESEPVADVAHLAAVIREYRRHGFRTAIDDFGAGYSGLGLLADLRPDFVKIDMGLTRGIDGDRVRRVIVDGITATCHALSIGVIAEGVETPAELGALRSLGVRYFQGYLFARPGLEALPDVHWPDAADSLSRAGTALGDTRVGDGTHVA